VGKRERKHVPAPLREWCKAPTELLGDARYTKLAMAHQGAYWSLLLFSLRESFIPGMFLDGDGEPLSAELICFRAAKSPEEYAALQDALPELRRTGLYTFTQDEGFAIALYVERHCSRDEVYKVQHRREGNKERKRKQRRGDNAPIPIRQEAE